MRISFLRSFNSARVGGACRWRDGEQTDERDEAVPRREGCQHDASRSMSPAS
jgi:hypothetical protein